MGRTLIDHVPSRPARFDIVSIVRKEKAGVPPRKKKAFRPVFFFFLNVLS